MRLPAVAKFRANAYMLAVIRLFAFGMGTALPLLAAQDCTQAALKALHGLEQHPTPLGVQQISALNQQAIDDVQRCLILRGCYDGNPKRVDHTVGPYTGVALYRFAYGQCTIATAAQKQPCGGDRDVISWMLTEQDVKYIEGLPPEPPLPAGEQEDDSSVAQLNGLSSQTSPADSPSTSPEQTLSSNSAAPTAQEQHGDAATAGETTGSDSKSDNKAQNDTFKSGLSLITNVEYPSESLFRNALEFLTGDEAQGDEADRVTASRELAPLEDRIVQRACKNHDMNQPVPEWKADWNANMVYSLSDLVYAFYPFGMFTADSTSAPPGTPEKPPAPYTIDFGVLGGIGWVGATFAMQDGKVELQQIGRHVDKGIDEQVEMARRFRTKVDLVVYKWQSEQDWREFASKDQNYLDLSNQIADEVTRQQSGFLNSVQKLALPDLLTIDSTAWDGVTLDFRNYPYADTDPRVMHFLVSLLRETGKALDEGKGVKRTFLRSKRNFDVNVVIPYEVFVPGGTCDRAQLTPATAKSRIMELATLVPRDRGVDNIRQTGNGSFISNFIVMLPQPTTCTKKALRQAIEDAFDRTPENLKLLKLHPELSLAEWRYQLLRRVIYGLVPKSQDYKGSAYSVKGSQLYDDLVYAKDNFGGVAFSGIPTYDEENHDLAERIRQVFLGTGAHLLNAASAPKASRAQRAVLYVANFFGGWRRELALLVESILAFLVIYALLSYWFIELRAFFQLHRWWFYGLLASAIIVTLLLCVFDRKLREDASYVYAAILFIAIIGRGVWSYICNLSQRQLP